MKEISREIYATIDLTKHPEAFSKVFSSRARRTEKGLINGVQGLLREGEPLTLRTLVATSVSTQAYVSEIAQQFGGLKRTPLVAITHADDPLGLRVKIDREPRRVFEKLSADAVRLSVPADYHGSLVKEGTLANLNAHLAQVRNDVLLNRLLYDPPQDELGKTKKLASVAILASAGSTALKLVGLAGPALIIAGQTDDVVNALAIDHNSLRKRSAIERIMDNKAVWAAVAAAGLIDLYLPAFLKSPDIDIRLLSSGVYWLTATAGSFAADIQDYRKIRKKIKVLAEGKDVSRREISNMAMKENLAYPYTGNLGKYGIPASLAASLLAGGGNLFVLPIIGGITPAIIGPLETAVALGLTHIQDRRRQGKVNAALLDNGS